MRHSQPKISNNYKAVVSFCFLCSSRCESLDATSICCSGVIECVGMIAYVQIKEKDPDETLSPFYKFLNVFSLVYIRDGLAYSEIRVMGDQHCLLSPLNFTSPSQTSARAVVKCGYTTSII